MRASLRSALALSSLTAIATSLALGHTASAGNPVVVVVLKEHGVGTSSAAQPFLDQFIGIAAKENAWDPASHGKYLLNRADADTFITAEKAQLGIFSLAAYLALKPKYNLEIIGEARPKGSVGGSQYFLVSKNVGDLAGCKGKTLASDHGDDPRFIDKVVFAGQAKLSDFTLVATKRFGEAGRKVLNGDAECALIDDAQLADVNKTAGGAKQVWASARLPGMVIVAFPSAPGPLKTGFQTSMPRVCQTGQATCDAVGIQSLAATSASQPPYGPVIALYGP